MLSANSFPIVPHYCPVSSQAGHLLDVVPARLEGVQADVLDGVLKVTKYLRTIFSIGKHVHSHSMKRPKSRQELAIFCNNSPQEGEEHTSCCTATEKDILKVGVKERPPGS